MKGRKATFYELFFIVEGAGSFPLDMLRYDSCFPAEESQSSKIEDHRRERRAILLCRRGVNPELQAHALARWHSFGWSVQYESTDRGAAFWAAENRNKDLREKEPT
jgi:hypothetical protein